jgi:cystathionine gamma-lyase/homocysteine desulfhydrase
MDFRSSLLHFKIDDPQASPAVTPVYQCSAFTAESKHFYSRKSNPNVLEFEEIIKKIEETQYCIAVATGMSALYLVLDLLPPNGTLVINKHIYGCSYKLFQRIAKQRQLQLLVLDLSIAENIAKIPAKTDMVIFETPTNPFLHHIDIAAISETVKKSNPRALIVVDNTWATSLHQKPLQWGADISLHSCTKYYSGHSDVMGGVILVNDSFLYEELTSSRFYSGTILTPYSAWLLRRSMQTFYVRMDYHGKLTKEMYPFLQKFPAVKKVYYPSIDGKQLTGYGGIVFFQLQDSLIDQYVLFRDSLKLFATGTGMACVTSMVAQPFTGSHASMTEEEKKEMDLNKGLVRLCFGLENIEDLKQDLIQAFNKITITNQTVIAE